MIPTCATSQLVVSKGKRVKKVAAVESSGAKLSSNITHTNASAGSKHKLYSKRLNQSLGPKRPLNDTEILEFISSPPMVKCCKSGNCFQNLFQNVDTRIDFNRLVSTFRNMREETRLKSKQEKEQYLMQLFKATILNKPAAADVCGDDLQFDENGLPIYNFDSGAFVHKWTLPGFTKSICKRSWARIYGFTPYQLDQCAVMLKANFNATGYSIRSYTDATLHDFTYNQTEDLLAKNVINQNEEFCYNFDPAFVRAALTPLADTQQMAVYWLEDHFSAYGDHAPDSLEVRMSVPTKCDLWMEYRRAQEAQRLSFVTKSRFNELWNAIYPYYLLRPWINVPGKCETCYEIDTLRKTSTDTAVHEALRQCHHLHRGGFFMPERKRYKENVMHALRNKGSVFSCIIDGMDQAHSRLPHLGSNCSFKKPLKQHIQGVLVHGVGVHFYRTFNNVPKGADLTIYCFLSSLELWRKNHPERLFPEEIYLQVDGGSENANQYLLAMLELLVVKRMVKKVMYSRLPTGHTHEDIDATFAHLWRWMRQRTVETIDDFRVGVEEMFKGTELHAQVFDVYVIPDYRQFFEKNDCIDRKLQGYTKLVQTQHRWSFEHVEVCAAFPLGCKVMYRAFSSDVVIEFIKKHKHQCCTPLGQITGLEGVTTYSYWYPDEKTFDSRLGIAGFYLLTRVPHVSCLADMSPMAFVENCSEAISDTLQEVRERWQYGQYRNIRETWEKWEAEHSPKLQSAEEYVVSHPYHVPFLFHWKSEVTLPYQKHWRSAMKSTFNNTDIVYPSAFAICTPSVASSWNSHPGPSRQYSTTNTENLHHVQNFRLKTQAYYDIYLESKTVMELKDLLKRRVKSSGLVESTSGVKKSLIGRLQRSDINYVSVLYRSLIPENLYFVQQVLTRHIRSVEDASLPLATITSDGVDYFITNATIKQFGIGQAIQSTGIDFMFLLLQKREEMNSEAHRQVHGGEHNYEPLKFSLFCLSSVWQALEGNEFDALRAKINLVQPHFLFIPIMPGVLATSWCSLCVNVEKRTISLYCPMLHLLNEDEVESMRVRIMGVWNLFNSHTEAPGPPPFHLSIVQPTEGQPFERCENEFDTGLFITAYVDLSSQCMPVAYDQTDINLLRMNLCYSVLNTRMPNT